MVGFANKTVVCSKGKNVKFRGVAMGVNSTFGNSEKTLKGWER